VILSDADRALLALDHALVEATHAVAAALDQLVDDGEITEQDLAEVCEALEREQDEIDRGLA
jgi:uncharacterized protein Yka (UPF0111/DUF47 family)